MIGKWFKFKCTTELQKKGEKVAHFMAYFISISLEAMTLYRYHWYVPGWSSDLCFCFDIGLCLVLNAIMFYNLYMGARVDPGRLPVESGG